MEAVELNQRETTPESSTSVDSAFSGTENFFEYLTFLVDQLFLFLKNLFISIFDFFSVFGISGPEDVALWLLSASSVVFILSKLGWLPTRIDRAINRNQRSEISTALELLGIKEREVRSKFRAFKFQGQNNRESINNRAERIAENYTIKKPVSVGGTNPAEEKAFIDLMGASTDHKMATQMAELLRSFIGFISLEAGTKNVPDFDYVATPKSGSPLIGYEFSRISGKPLMLHSLEPKYRDDDGNSSPIAHFDLNFKPDPGAKVLIIDDSSTGGRKVVSLIKDLKKLDLEVNHCVVIFEPQSKINTNQNASKVLNEEGVELISITKRP